MFVFSLDCVDGKSNDKHVCCFPVQIGTVLKKLFEDNVVKREELFITSKLWYIYVMLCLFNTYSVDKCSFNQNTFCVYHQTIGVLIMTLRMCQRH